MTKISQIPDIGSNLAANDEFVIRDVSDASTPNKKVTASGFIDYVIAQGSVGGFTQISAGAGTAAAPSISFAADTNTGLFNPAADTLAFAEGGVECARFDSSGRLLVGTSTAAATGGVLQLSSGITFPATAVAASDANTLDDYEEGTWTPTKGNGVTAVGTFASVGSYTKIGKVVIYAGYIFASTSVAYNPAEGSLVENGLPFSVLSGVGSGIATASAAATISAFPTGVGISGQSIIGTVSVIYFSGSYLVN